MNAKKKLSAGTVVTLLAAVLAIVSFVIYSMGINGAGYFKDAAVSNLPVFLWLAVAALACALVLSKLSVKGAAGKVVDLVVGLLQIAAPVLLALCLINMVAGRVEGLGFIYFSNADVALEVQTPENLASASNAITAMVCFGISSLVAMVAAFFNLKKA